MDVPVFFVNDMLESSVLLESVVVSDNTIIGKKISYYGLHSFDFL